MIALDPGQTVEVRLPSYADRPATEQPVFRVKFLTAREQQRFQETLNEYIALTEAESTTYGEILDKLERMTAMLVVGWSNVTMPDGSAIPFAPAALGEALTFNELVELFHEARSATWQKELDRKNLHSRSGSCPGASANGVPTAAATSS